MLNNQFNVDRPLSAPFIDRDGHSAGRHELQLTGAQNFVIELSESSFMPTLGNAVELRFAGA